jgi:hypothetical protein
MDEDVALIKIHQVVEVEETYALEASYAYLAYPAFDQKEG